jgi:hypothetical protein
MNQHFHSFFGRCKFMEKNTKLWGLIVFLGGVKTEESMKNRKKG